MISNASQKWPCVIFVALAIANPQYPPSFPMQFPPMMQQPIMMPLAPQQPAMVPIGPFPPPMMPMLPPPMPMQVGLAVISNEKRDETKKRTTTCPPRTKRPTTPKSKDLNIIGSDNMAIAVPMPFPPPSPAALFAIPGMMSVVCKKNRRHPSCPPCPPCSCSPCTPAFFSYCSECHLKCRCKNAKDVPIPLPLNPPVPLPGPAFPMPYPMPGPLPVPIPQSPDVILVPFPPQIVPPSVHKEHHFNCDRRRRKNDASSNSEDYNTDSESSEHSQSKKYDIFRRKNGPVEINRSDNMLVKPVLSYLSDDGEVRLKRPLNKNDVSKLLDDDDEILTKDDKIGSVRARSSHKAHKSKKTGITRYDIGSGRKRLIFRPPADMMFSNLSVSFDT